VFSGVASARDRHWAMLAGAMGASPSGCECGSCTRWIACSCSFLNLSNNDPVRRTTHSGHSLSVVARPWQNTGTHRGRRVGCAPSVASLAGLRGRPTGGGTGPQFLDGFEWSPSDR